MLRTKKRNIAHENNLEKTKIIFQYSVMSVSSVICGAFFPRFLSEPAVTTFVKRLLCNFSDCCIITDGYCEIIFRLLRYSAPQLFSIALIFIFSFSFINYIISDIILVFNGFGYSLISVLFIMSPMNTLTSIVFVFFNILSLTLITFYSCILSFFSLELRAFSLNGRANLKITSILKMLLQALMASGCVLAINFMCKSIIYFLEKE